MAKHFASKPSNTSWGGQADQSRSTDMPRVPIDKNFVDNTKPFPRLVDTGMQSTSSINVPFVDPPAVTPANQLDEPPIDQLVAAPVDSPVSQTGSHFAPAPADKAVSRTGSHFATTPADQDGSVPTDRVVSQTGSHFAAPSAVYRDEPNGDEPNGDEPAVPPVSQLDEIPMDQPADTVADKATSRTGSHFAVPPVSQLDDPPIDPFDAAPVDSPVSPSASRVNIPYVGRIEDPPVDPFDYVPESQPAYGTGSHFAPSSQASSRTGSHFAPPSASRSTVPPVDQFDDARPEQRNAPSAIFFEPPRRRVWPKVLVCVLVIAVAFCCVEGAFLYASVGTVRTHAHAIMSSASKFADAAKKGDVKVIERSAQGIAEESRAMRDELNTIPWVVASYVPVVGSDARSMFVISDVLVDLSKNALTPMAQNASLLSLANLVGDSAVNMEALKSLAEVASHVAPSVIEAGDKVEALPEAVLPQIDEVVKKASDAIGTAGTVAEYINPMLSDLPMLMGDGGQTRTYLIVASNNSELHALGGFVGQVGVLSVTDGHFELGEFANTMTQLPTNTLSAGATEEEIQVFGERADTHHGDHNIIPDFSRVGQLYYNVWDAAKQQQLDGVIGVDPVFLQRMLALTGGVDTSYGVTVDGNNAAAVIMNKCLFWWAPKVCDEFYKEVASLSFDKLLHNLGKVDLIDFTRVVVQSSGEGRCMAWLHDETAQRHVMQAGFGWELPHDPTAPVTGIFASDASTTKAAYYLSLDTQVGTPTKNGDGSTIYPVSVTFKHNMDRELLDTDYPGYLHSDAPDKSKQRSTSELIEQVRLIAPEGGRIENVTQEFANSTLPPRDMNWQHLSYQGLDTWGADMYLDVDESCTISYVVVTSPEATEPLQIRRTPVVPHDIRGD